MVMKGVWTIMQKCEELLVQFVCIKFGTSNEESLNLHVSAQWPQ